MALFQCKLTFKIFELGLIALQLGMILLTCTSVVLNSFILAANTEALKSQGGGANRFNTVHNQAIQNLIAKEIIELKNIKGKEKFFGGPEPNFADIEIYGILNFIEHFEPEIFNELITRWSLEKWYKRVKTSFS